MRGFSFSEALEDTCMEPCGGAYFFDQDDDLLASISRHKRILARNVP